MIPPHRSHHILTRPSIPEQPVYICEVDTTAGVRHFITYLEPDIMFAHGLFLEAIVGVLARPLGPDESITPETLIGNKAFVDYLHRFIAQNAPQLPGLIAYARQQGTGLVFITDMRTPSPNGKVPPEDLIGIFVVKEGKVSSETYKPNPNHQLLTANGFFQLMPELHTQLVQELTIAAKSPRT